MLHWQFNRFKKKNSQGHCISTITPAGGPGYGAENYEYGPNGLDPYNQSKDKIISTEGCFSCKVNGRGKRSIQSSNSTGTSTIETALNTSKPLEVKIKLEQTRHRTNIIQLQPALKDVKVKLLYFLILLRFTESRLNIALFNLQDYIKYEIVRGNEGNQFEMMKKRGVWSLHFRRRLKERANFKLEIQAVGDEDYDYSESEAHVDDSLDFQVHIHVVN